jgi:xylulokinase
MANVYLAGIDIGTTGAKVVLCDAQGQVAAQASQEYPTSYPRPNWAEQDPEDWWAATCRIVRRALDVAGIDPQQIAAIAVSDQAPSVVAVDRQGEPLGPALIWMDRRSQEQCAWLRAEVGAERIATINGGCVDPYFLAPKLLWVQQHAPALYARCHQVLQANGYIVHRLCGAFCMDSAVGPLSLLFDSAAQNWSPELVGAMRLDATKLPPVAPCTQIVGHVSAQAAAVSGFAAGTPVLAGMVDGTAAAIEAGLVHTGQAVEMTGQSTVLMIVSARPYQGQALFGLGHAVPGLHLVVGAQVATGGALRWFRDQLGAEERAEAARLGSDPFALLSQAAASSPPGANRLVFLPYMYGERSPIWDADARGVLFGLSLATTKGDIVRAVMEGAAFGLRHNIEVAAAGGYGPATLASVGGGARSAVWNQIKADILQRSLQLPSAASGAAMGDAIVAAAGAGIYGSVAEAVAHMVAPGPEYQPRPHVAALYDELYQVYRALYPALRGEFGRLAGVPDVTLGDS